MGGLGSPGSVAEYDFGELEEYYGGIPWEYGYASLCRMTLPEDLSGQTAVDVGCRRGKGVFKLSERVGEDGRAIGVDWRRDHIAEAESRMDDAYRKTGLSKNNMEFHFAYPEDLSEAGLEDGVADMVFVNSVCHLMRDPQKAFSEMHRVLKTGGQLVINVALATSPRDESVIEAARALGNSIQAAPCAADFMAMLERIGFRVEVVGDPVPVSPSQGYLEDYEVPTAPSEEDVQFEAAVIYATKL